MAKKSKALKKGKRLEATKTLGVGGGGGAGKV